MKLSRRARAWLPAGAYMLLIWALSSISHPFKFERVPFQDKGVHFIEYGVLAWLLSYAVRGTWPAWRARSVFALAWSVTVLWGLLDEIHQAYVPGRVADAVDLLADSIGGFAGALVFIAIWGRGRAGSRLRATDSSRTP